MQKQGEGRVRGYILKYLALVILAINTWSGSGVVNAGGLVDQMIPEDSCGVVYADKLASCTPFHCTQPSPLAMMFGFPSDEEIAGMPPEQQQKIHNMKAEAEKKMAAMSLEQRAAMKAKMTSVQEIKGYDAQGRCQTLTQPAPDQHMSCTFDKAMLQRVVDYTRRAANADHIQISASSHLEDGRMVTKQTDMIDGKSTSNPWKDALDNGQCKFLMKDDDRGFVTENQLNRIRKTSSAPKASGSTPAGHKKPTQTGNKDKSNTLFILDASGSMWGQINGKPKITIAKEVMKKLIPELPGNGRIGLIAYGHRRKGDCNDVETLVRLGADHKQVVLGAVNGLNAKGKTPLTRSVNQAVEMLRSEEDASTVVLVSDGLESCGGDPCAAVKAAKGSGVKFVLHTVGFGLNKQESTQLQCMAKAGGGQYFQANSADELLKSTRKAVKSKGPGYLKLTLKSNGKPVYAWVRLTGNGSIGLAELTNDAGVEPGHSWRLQPGVYKLETYPASQHGVPPMVVDGLKIESGKPTIKTLDFSGATLRLTAKQNGQPAVVQINLKNLANGETVFDTATFSTFTMRGVKTPHKVKLTPGKYHLSVRLPLEQTKADLSPHEEDIELGAGAVLDKTIDIATDILRVMARKDGKAVKAKVFVDDLKAHRNVFNSDFVVSGGLETPYDMTLLPGKYRLTVALPDGGDTRNQDLLLDSGGKLIEKTFDFQSTSRPVAAKGMEMDTDRPWNDFRNFVPQTADPAVCQAACEKDEGCKAWTYVKPNTVQGPEPHCYLKSPAPDPTPNTCCVSGLGRH